MSSRTVRRRKEFGVRLALGATRAHIQAITLSQTGAILLAGILSGAVLAFLALRAASRLLYGSVPGNASAVLLAALVLSASGLTASFIPARRAAFADPLDSLRED